MTHPHAFRLSADRHQTLAVPNRNTHTDSPIPHAIHRSAQEELPVTLPTPLTPHALLPGRVNP
jgi:hypothetical protein